MVAAALVGEPLAALSAALAFLIYLRSTGQGFWDPSYNREL